MKKIAYFILFLFVAFIATPTVVTYLDKSADVSMAFTANEEENSSKTEIGFEYTFHENTPSVSVDFLHEQEALNQTYKAGYGLICLDVISPPPRLA